MMTNVMTTGENAHLPACSIYFIDLINQKLLRLQLFEKDNFNCPEIYAPGVITPKGLRAFVTSFCHATLLPLCVGKEENCMPFLDTKNFDAYMLRSRSWPDPNSDNIYIAMIPKKFGVSIDSPFSTPMEFDYHDLGSDSEE